MSAIIANAQITIQDLNDPIISDSAPTNPTEGLLWLDTSSTPNVLRIWSSSNSEWSIVNDTKNIKEDVDGLDKRISKVITKNNELKMDFNFPNDTTSSLSGTGIQLVGTNGIFRVDSSQMGFYSKEKVTDSTGEEVKDSNNNPTYKLGSLLLGFGKKEDETATGNKLYVKGEIEAEKFIATTTDESTNTLLTFGVNGGTMSFSKQVGTTKAENLLEYKNGNLLLKGEVEASKFIATTDAKTYNNEDTKLAFTVNGGTMSFTKTLLKDSNGDEIADPTAEELLWYKNGNLYIKGAITASSLTITGEAVEYFNQQAKTALKKDLFFTSDNPPESSEIYESYRWLDTGVTPNQIRTWRALSETPSGATMTTDRSIDETVEAVAGAEAIINNTNNTITSDITITATAEDDSTATATITVNGEPNTVTLTNGTGSMTLSAEEWSYTITADAAIKAEYTCSGWVTVNDTSSLQSDVEMIGKIASDASLGIGNVKELADGAIQAAADNAKDLARVVRIVNGKDGAADGYPYGYLEVGDNQTNASIRITSSAIDLCLEDQTTHKVKAVATYAQDYIRLKNMQVRVPDSPGGLVFSFYEG